MSARAVIALGVAASLLGVAASASAEPCLRGVNMSGAEFGELGGKPNHGYAYPTADALKAIAEKGATAIRLPFRWEHLQPKPRGAFDKDELKRLEDTVEAAQGSGLTVILDPHNYAQYRGQTIGTRHAPVADFVDLWVRLAKRFRDQPRVVFSLMNEPFDAHASSWAQSSQAAIDAIRKAGALNFVIVPGTAWTGAHSWSSDLKTGRNDVAMAKVADPLGRMAFDFHQYLDGDYSGRSPDCPSAERALKAIDEVSAWLKAGDRRGFLGEFAASDRPECISAMKVMAEKLNADPKTWIGWTAWGAGAWWPKDYIFNLEPTDAGERPQMAALKGLFADNAGCDLGPRT